MKRGKFQKKGSSGNKALILVLVLTLLVGGAIGGTIAWLVDSTAEVKNTFTTSDINITLDEGDELDLKMIPGHTITKDPVVAVVEGSEDCYLFVKVEKSENYDDFMSHEIAEGWEELEDEDGVYYRTVMADAEEREFAVLAGDQVVVSPDVTKADMNALTAETYPTLTFTAYAIQLNSSNGTAFDVADAWDEINP